jgi:hypothetical protein
VSRSDLVDNIDEIGCCDRLFGHVVLTSYLYRFGAWLMQLFRVQVEVQVCAWLMHLFMVHVEVQVGEWLMHLFMVQVDYRLRYRLVHSLCTCLWYSLIIG